jgi:hypothetical protein
MPSSFWDLYDVPLGLEIGLPSAAFVAGFIYLAERHRTRSRDDSDTQTNRQPAATQTGSRRTPTVVGRAAI